MRIRQIALVARELEPTVSAICDVLDLEVGFRDPGVKLFGLSNAVIPVGDTFLEVVSPTKKDTTAGRLLDRRGGDGGYMVILQSSRHLPPSALSSCILMSYRPNLQQHFRSQVQASATT